MSTASPSEFDVLAGGVSKKGGWLQKKNTNYAFSEDSLVPDAVSTVRYNQPLYFKHYYRPPFVCSLISILQ